MVRIERLSDYRVTLNAYTLNRGDFGTVFLSFVRRLSCLGDPKCTETIGRKYLGTSSCVLCREIVLISNRVSTIRESTVLYIGMVAVPRRMVRMERLSDYQVTLSTCT